MHRTFAMCLFSLKLGVDASLSVLQRAAGTPGAAREDLREDREGNLGRRIGADVEPGRARDSVDVLSHHARFEQPLAPSLLVAARTECTDVERIRLERSLERRDV